MTTATLEPQEIKKVIEGLLFVASEPVTLSYLAEVLECNLEQVQTALEALAEECRQRGLRVQRQAETVQLVTAPELTGYIERFLGLNAPAKLSTPALETLAIIAYRQPITRPEIEAIRGVNSDGVLRNLISKGLVEEVGRLETVGHPTLFGTTFEFLRYFGLEKVEGLPALDLPQRQLPKNGAGHEEEESYASEET
jgi:segregation and condensation protein B